jgi:hypothetical protein
MEVEEEVLAHPSVMACAAFSAKHNVLQETVGIVIQPNPNFPKIDLRMLHDFLQSRLANTKWPQVLVFMGGLPKSHTNKLLRVKLGERLGLPEFNHAMLAVERTYEATCPPQGTPVGRPIDCKAVVIDARYVEHILHRALGGDGEELSVTTHQNRYGSLIVHTKSLNRKDIIKTAEETLDAYLQPTHICLHALPDIPLNKYYCEQVNPKAADAVRFIAMMDDYGTVEAAMDPVVKELQGIVQVLVDLDCLPPPDTSFFQVGGTSLRCSFHQSSRQFSRWTRNIQL